MAKKDLVKQSREDWTSGECIEAINAGSLKRIADATEKMCLNYNALIRESNLNRERADRYWNALEYERRSAAALRGVITKLKKKLAELEK